MREVAGPADAHAGTAALSRSREVQQTDRSFLAPGATPLYLRIEGVQDIAALGVDLRWWPNELVGPCCYLVEDTTTVPDCGGLSWSMPAGGIDGDSSYTSSLVFAPGAGRTCVTYWVRGENCAQRPATFCLTAVKVQHSDGSVEDLEVVSGATLLGGVEEGCPLLAQAVSPDTIQSGGTASPDILGSGFDEGATVQLVLGGTTLEASGTTRVTPQHLQASFEIQPGLTGVADVVIDQGAGEADTLAQALAILGPEGPPYHPNTVIAKFRGGVVTMPPGMTSGDLASQTFEPEAVEGFLGSLGVTTVARIAAASAAIGPGGPALPDSSVLDYFLLTLADSNVVAVREQLEGDSADVESALLNDNGVWCGSGFEGPSPIDRNFRQQWWLNNSRADSSVVVRDGVEDMDLRGHSRPGRSIRRGLDRRCGRW
jgi:hypothetical protein